ncbi:MAG: family 1 encapsulin nanocompartment shell protein [Armatimonadota bacterium]
MRYLPRGDAPFGDGIWEHIDEAVIGAAKSQLAGRRLLELVGPLGFETRALDRGEGAADVEEAFGGASAAMTAPRTTPIPLLHSEFRLPIRSVAAAEATKAPLDLSAAANAAIACARLEDALVFHGSKALDIEGLLTASGASRLTVSDWSQEGAAVDDLIKAITGLDEAGFSGPYAAALAPALHNALFGRYKQGNMTYLDHARQALTAGIVKAPVLASGGVVLAAGKQFASIVVGRDMTTGFIGPSGTDYEFIVLESICPAITVGEAICVLEVQS